jgi:hypothetical protein
MMASNELASWFPWSGTASHKCRRAGGVGVDGDPQGAVVVVGAGDGDAGGVNGESEGRGIQGVAGGVVGHAEQVQGAAQQQPGLGAGDQDSLFAQDMVDGVDAGMGESFPGVVVEPVRGGKEQHLGGAERVERDVGPDGTGSNGCDRVIVTGNADHGARHGAGQRVVSGLGDPAEGCSHDDKGWQDAGIGAQCLHRIRPHRGGVLVDEPGAGGVFGGEGSGEPECEVFRYGQPGVVELPCPRIRASLAMLACEETGRLVRPRNCSTMVSPSRRNSRPPRGSNQAMIRVDGSVPAIQQDTRFAEPGGGNRPDRRRGRAARRVAPPSCGAVTGAPVTRRR